MSVGDELKAFRGESSPEHKFKALRRILLGPVVTVEGVAALLKQIDAEIVRGLPDSIPPAEFARLIDWLAGAASDLQDIVEALPAETDDDVSHLTR